MAFNFNWSPLIADTVRARDMLTVALNKSPKPPIIVDDILVTELNLGSIPPDLEILEIGDLAEDRFRGIFKMTYTGDAFLTLNTRVQANPLKTYLSTKPIFASPQPLAAASGLTIPLQISLSEIRLSGFVILVFSRQKGLTLVFRNDPLESLKVSSTFDSIPFVREYLQKEIEAQLRVLFMEDLPAILHRLSLRLWAPDYIEQEIATASTDHSCASIDPLASPPQDPTDWKQNSVDVTSVPSLHLDTDELNSHGSFSPRNLYQLAQLATAHGTLSLQSPFVREAVFRSWAGFPELGSDIQLPHTPTLPKSISELGIDSSKSLPASPPSCLDADIQHRGTLFSQDSQSHLMTTRHAHQRKRKNRVINLRRSKTDSKAPQLTMSSNSKSQNDDQDVLGSQGIKLGLREHQRPTDKVLCPTIPGEESNRQNCSKEQSEEPPSIPDLAYHTNPEDHALGTGLLRLSEFSASQSTYNAKHSTKQSSPAKVTPISSVETPVHTSFSSLRSHTSERPSFLREGSNVGALEHAWLRKIENGFRKLVESERTKGAAGHKQDISAQEHVLDRRNDEPDYPPPAYSAMFEVGVPTSSRFAG